MKVKLVYKFFTAFSLSALAIVALMIGVLQLFTYRNLSDYMNQTMLAQIDGLVAELQEEYRSHNRWDHRVFRPLLDRHLPEFADPRRHAPEDSRPPHLSTPNRLSLFDAEKRPVAGPARSANGHTFREIEVDGKIVGWIGLRTGDEVLNPLDAAFLSKQIKAFYVIGVVILVLAGLISWVLSRHLLAPIRQLATGTKALASLKFHTKIKVSSEDELGQLATDFNTMARTLQKYEEMRRQWITDISHELRTPLAVLRGEIEAMQDGIRELNMETLSSLHSEVLRISRLVNDLHTLSLADSQNLYFKKEPIRPILVLRDTLKAFQTRFHQQNIDVVSDLPEGDGGIAEGDRDRLAQLFSNLIENTMRYTDPPATLKVSALTAKGRVIVRFEDSAPAVPTAALGRIFDRLYRVDKSRSRAFGGSGLGLSICKQIVETHGGTIGAAHSPLGGLLIEITIPIVCEEESKRHGNAYPNC